MDLLNNGGTANQGLYKRDMSSTSAVELVGSIPIDLVVENGGLFQCAARVHGG